MSLPPLPLDLVAGAAVLVSLGAVACLVLATGSTLRFAGSPAAPAAGSAEGARF